MAVRTRAAYVDKLKTDRFGVSDVYVYLCTFYVDYIHLNYVDLEIKRGDSEFKLIKDRPSLPWIQISDLYI